MRSWFRDLAAEEYISPDARDAVMGWVDRYEVLRLDPTLRERITLQRRLARAAELAAWKDWATLHDYVAEEEGAS
jgi:hypothetical protein